MNTIIEIVLILVSLLYYVGSLGTKDNKQAQFFFIAGVTLTVILLASLKFH